MLCVVCCVLCAVCVVCVSAAVVPEPVGRPKGGAGSPGRGLTPPPAAPAAPTAAATAIAGEWRLRAVHTALLRLCSSLFSSRRIPRCFAFRPVLGFPQRHLVSFAAGARTPLPLLLLFVHLALASMLTLRMAVLFSLVRRVSSLRCACWWGRQTRLW